MLKKWKEEILYRFYELTKNSENLHEWFRVILFEFEIPLIKLALRILSQNFQLIIQPRHSLMEKNGFNLFMSDIDLDLIIQKEAQVQGTLNAFQKAKRILPNLGEPEVMTQEEYDRARKNETAHSLFVWSQTFQIRKLHWQRIKTITGLYEKEKISRGLARSAVKLKKHYNIIHLANIVPDLPTVVSKKTFELPYYSPYLEQWIALSVHDQKDTILCPTEEAAHSFICLLPEFEYSTQYECSALRKYLLIKEINMSKCQARILQHKGLNFDSITTWIERLENQLSLATKTG